jgi:hypothetical protein
LLSKRLTDFADKHGGFVDPCPALNEYVLKLMRTPPHRLICRKYKFGDGTYLIARMALNSDGDGKRLLVWSEGNVSEL